MRSNKQLRDAVEHVQFEVDRLAYCAEVWRHHSDAKPHNVSAALREACMVHCRNLIAFFYPAEHPNPSDVLAKDFFLQPSDWHAPCPDWLARDRTRLHRLLSHLTYKRIKYKKQGEMVWDLDRLVRQLVLDWKRFIDSLPPSRGAWFHLPTADLG